MLSSEFIENVIERESSPATAAAAGRPRGRTKERVRARGVAGWRKEEEEVDGVDGVGVRGVVAKTAVAGTSFPSFRRRRSSLARRSEDVSEGKLAVDVVDGVLDSTESTEVR